MAVKTFKVGNAHTALHASGWNSGDEFPYVPLNGDMPAAGKAYLIMDGSGRPQVVTYQVYGAYTLYGQQATVNLDGATRFLGLVPDRHLNQLAAR